MRSGAPLQFSERWRKGTNPYPSEFMSESACTPASWSNRTTTFSAGTSTSPPESPLARLRDRFWSPRCCANFPSLRENFCLNPENLQPSRDSTGSTNYTSSAGQGESPQQPNPDFRLLVRYPDFRL